jgi:hypothetical protein
MDLARRMSKTFFRCKTSQIVRFEISVVVSVEKIVFWGVTPCGLVDSYHYFGGMCQQIVTSWKTVFFSW